MSKGTFFTGQPIFNQILGLVPHSLLYPIVRKHQSDRYCKSFKTYNHLVTMLYAILNQCTSLREVTTGLLAWEHRIKHLGMQDHPRRSTLSDANIRRPAEVFEEIYKSLYHRYKHYLPDSRKRNKKKDLYIFDSTTISLCQDILKGPGRPRIDGKRKGGIKVHTLLHAGTDIPVMVRYSAAAASDASFLKEVSLPANSVIVFDKGYRDYLTYNRFSNEKITWITRHRASSVYTVKCNNKVNDIQKKQGVLKDRLIVLGHKYQPPEKKVRCRMITYRDPISKKRFEFISNNMRLSAINIANYYQKRWQIETFFKRIKQNFGVKYFLGDDENAIKIQIWCALIADLLLKVIKQSSRSKMAYSNLTSLVRLHMMTYMDIKTFLRAPEKELIRKMKAQQKRKVNPTLFSP